MNVKLTDQMWKISGSKTPTDLDRFILLVLAMAGIISAISLAEWWFREAHIANLFLFVLLSLFFWYGILRIILIWINYLKIRKPATVPVPESGMSVAVFTTSAPGEPLSMFENTFKALHNLNYPHTTYLLDSTEDPAFRELAEKHGIIWMDLANLPGAKAGKINEA